MDGVFTVLDDMAWRGEIERRIEVDMEYLGRVAGDRGNA